MKKYLLVATTLIAGAALAQTDPVASPAPAVAPAPTAPMAHPMRDKTITRAEALQMVRSHFAAMDANKDGAVTAAEIDEVHASRMKDFDKSKGGGHHMMMMMGDPNAAFDQMDMDKNGSISRDEFAKAHEQRVEHRMMRREERKAASKDGRDGHRGGMRMHGMGGHMIAMADTNKDGRITQAEAEAMALQHFDQMDTNKDGQVTPEERRAGRKMMFKRSTEEKKSGS